MTNLDLSFNSLRILKSNTFIGLVNLKKLYLNNNILVEIEIGAFNGLNNLEELYLNNNDFDNSDKLSRLDRLNSDELGRLKVGSFDGLKNLKLLDLNSCSINKITSNLFLGLDNLNSLNLDGNYIVKLEYYCFNGLLNIENLHLCLQIPKMELNYFIGKGLENLKNLHLSGIDTLIPRDSLKKILKLHGLKSIESIYIFSYYEDIYLDEEKEGEGSNGFNEIPDNSKVFYTKLNFTSKKNKIYNEYTFPVNLIEKFIDLYIFIKNIPIDINQLNFNNNIIVKI